MKNLSQYLTEGLNIGKATYNDILRLLEESKLKPVEDLESHGNWKTEEGEYNFHGVDDSYKFFIFAQQTGARRGMENRYIFGPSANPKYGKGKDIMVSGEYSGDMKDSLEVVLIHFDQKGDLEYYSVENLYPNGSYAGYGVQNSNDSKGLEMELSKIVN